MLRKTCMPHDPAIPNVVTMPELDGGSLAYLNRTEPSLLCRNMRIRPTVYLDNKPLFSLDLKGLSLYRKRRQWTTVFTS